MQHSHEHTEAKEDCCGGGGECGGGGGGCGGGDCCGGDGAAVDHSHGHMETPTHVGGKVAVQIQF